MERRPAIAFVTATTVAAGSAMLGVWLPWVRKRPVGHHGGQPYFTAEWVAGLKPGLQGSDPLVVLLVGAVVLLTVGSRYSPWHPDGVLVAAGALLIGVFGNVLHHYWTVDRYAVEPGLYLVIAGGFLLVLLGVGGLLGRRGFLDDGSTDEDPQFV
jgi:hypothetical protein